MAKLTTAQRNALPSSAFAIPSQRKYPINDPSHARNALARASQQEHKGNLSSGAEAHIRAQANKKLGKMGRAVSK